MTKTSSYWDKRALRRLTDAEKISDEHITRIKAIYEQAYRDVSKEIERTYKAYSKNTGLDVEKLKELLTKKETDKVWKTLKRQGLDEYIKNNYKARISRLEQIQAQIYAKAKLIYPKEELEHTMAYKGVINDSYYKAVYDTQMGTGYDFSFTKIDKNMTQLLLNEKWSGLNYSDRVWKNTDYLADALAKTLGGAMISGQGIEKTTRQIKERFRVSKYYAERLVRTETNHFHNEADAMAYEDMGVKKYVFVATLDSRTSPICQSHDNKVYNFKDKKVGVNYPPLHPNCRSKTRGYISEEVEKTLQRRARNPKTGRTEVIDNISYEEWAKKNGLVTKPKVDKPVRNKDIDKNNLTAKLNEIEFNNRNLKHEVGTILDKQGNILATYDGGDHEVNVTDRSLLKDNVFTHNHPTGGTFSEGDINSFITYDLHELRASTDTEVYSLSKLGNKQDPNFYKDFKSHSYEFYSKATKDINQKILKGELDFNPRENPAEYMRLVSKYKANYYDEWLLENAKNYGYKYEKIPLVDMRVASESVKIKKPRNNVTINISDLPKQMTSSKKELANSQKLIDYINNQKDADPKVVNMYKSMGKITNMDFKVSHAKDSSLRYSTNILTHDISDLKLVIPNIDSVNDVANINIVLHENMHFIDFMKGNKYASRHISLEQPKLVDIVCNGSRDIPSNIKDIFDEYNKGCKDIANKVIDKYKPLMSEVNSKIRNNLISYKDYNKEYNALKRARSLEIDALERSYMGGGINNLQDIYDALNMGMYRDKSIVRYGHGSKYYLSRNNRVSEIVANYGALSITRPDLIELLKADKPALVSELDKLIDTILGGA